MIALGVDTSNYATSLAAVDTDKREVVCSLKRFLPVKEGARGLRQSDAVFHHTVALPQLLDELAGTLDLVAVGAVAVAEKPRPAAGSYMPCFLAGVSFAAALAGGLGLPLHRTSHQQGHLAAARLENEALLAGADRLLFLHASGGTTELLLAEGYEIKKELGKSLDLYAGQAVDRLGVKLGHAFPAGPAVSALAEEEPADIRPRVSVAGCDCHLSGLENQCDTLLKEGKAPAYVAKYCLLALADTFDGMIKNALAAHPGTPVLLAGGVACSTTIRRRLLAANPRNAILFASPALSADNAVGIALFGTDKRTQGA